ncbi:hypothetical protein CICLE_v10013078mg [Citrus x clementina]|uniref:Uncharacterized protein n=1 Tax=Citrus clementina TaxID=85681 RepID=V4SYT7_CITCL|nr:light-harvesting complex-like protein OHP1, chloroplastic [Citrus x clementina]ESR42376.1 hypothetical protein CICLE_v10013078mg [Citrus x clementina]
MWKPMNEAQLLKAKTKAAMASSSLISSSLLPTKFLTIHRQSQQLSLFNNHSCKIDTASKRLPTFRVEAAKIPSGVDLPRVQPKFQAPFLGFTKTAEIWNSRACMIGIVFTFIVELILNKGILQVIGVEVGKGLDLPL